MTVVLVRSYSRHSRVIWCEATVAISGQRRAISAIVASVFYAVMRLVSENVLTDTILSLGMMICFYYGLTAFACVWYFRHEYRLGFAPLLMKGLLPLAGGAMLAAMFLQLAVATFDPAYGSGGAILGVGTVFAIGVGILMIGALLMLVWRFRAPEFFRGHTLRHDTPALIVEEPVG